MQSWVGIAQLSLAVLTVVVVPVVIGIVRLWSRVQSVAETQERHERAIDALEVRGQASHDILIELRTNMSQVLQRLDKLNGGK